VGTTCYLNSALQLLHAADVKWSEGNLNIPLVRLFHNFMEKKLSNVQEFVAALEQILHRSLKTLSDSRLFLCQLIDMFQAVDSNLLGRLQYGGPKSVTYCVHCQKRPTSRFVPIPYNYVYIEATGSVQKSYDAAFHKCRECVDCECPTDIRSRNQFEITRFTKYPQIILLCTTPAPGPLKLVPDLQGHFEISATLNTPDLGKYVLIGLVLSTPGYGVGHAYAVVKHNLEWFRCDDSNIQSISEHQVFTAASTSDVVVLSYKRIN